MAQYVDGYVLPVPTDKLPQYRRLARQAAKIWRKHGALEYRECVGEDLEVKGMVPFTRAAKAKAGETVVFAWITFKSRADRDRVNAKVMNDPHFANMSAKDMPFDMKRIVYGGFKTLVSL